MAISNHDRLPTRPPPSGSWPLASSMPSRRGLWQTLCCLLTAGLSLFGAASVAHAQTTVRYQQSITGGVTFASNAFYIRSSNNRTLRVPADTDGDPSTAVSSSTDLVLPAGSAQLSSRTFWTFAREFSPFLAATGDDFRHRRLRAE
jgi:hypothetical protein